MPFDHSTSYERNSAGKTSQEHNSAGEKRHVNTVRHRNAVRHMNTVRHMSTVRHMHAALEEKKTFISTQHVIWTQQRWKKAITWKYQRYKDVTWK